MQKYVLRKGNDKLLILRKGANFSEDDFSYTETSDDVIITEYIGSNADVKVLDRFRNFYILGRPESLIKKYTITYDETEYTAAPEEGYGLIITNSTKENVDLSNDFTIVQG